MHLCLCVCVCVCVCVTADTICWGAIVCFRGLRMRLDPLPRARALCSDLGALCVHPGADTAHADFVVDESFWTYFPPKVVIPIYVTILYFGPKFWANKQAYTLKPGAFGALPVLGGCVADAVSGWCCVFSYSLCCARCVCGSKVRL